MTNLVHTYKSQSFGGAVRVDKKDGKRHIALNAPKFLQNFLNVDCKPDEHITLVVTTKKPKRSIRQNNYYWGVYLPIIAKDTGEEDVTRLHELFKGMFLTKEIVEVMKKKVRITKSTTDLSVSDFCEYILAIEKFTGIEAPPTENYDLAPLHKPLTPVRQKHV